MLNKHPGAQLLRTAGDPPVDIRFGTDQYIQCTSVAPEPDRTSPIFSNLDVPLAVRSYYEHRSALSFLDGPRTYIHVSFWPTVLSTCSVARDLSPRGGRVRRNPGSKRPTSQLKRRSLPSCAGRRSLRSRWWRSHLSSGCSMTSRIARRSWRGYAQSTRPPSRPGNRCRQTL